MELSRFVSSAETLEHPLKRQKTGTEQRVGFDGDDDPFSPLNWPTKKKAATTILYSLMTMGSTWATSSYAPAIPEVAEEFRVSNVVSTLGTTLMLFGYGVGPLLWAPISEVYGRRVSVLYPYFIGAMFAFGTGASKDFAAICMTRFFTGVFSSAPVCNTGGVLKDIWQDHQRGAAMAMFAFAVSAGPLIASIVSSAIVNYYDWRWTQYVTGIFMCLTFVIGYVYIDETDAGVLLAHRAWRLPIEHGNWALHAEHEEWQPTIEQMAKKYMVVPLRLAIDPICFLMSPYASFVYTILYLTFSAFPLEFEGIGTLIGCILACCVHLANNSFYVRKLEQNNHKPVPEARLPPMMIGSIFFTAGLFLFGWTSSPHILWVGPVFGAGFIGFGFLCIFQAILNYLIDTFQQNASAALAANTTMRSAMAGAFPLFATALFENLGIQWASTLLGCIAGLMVPIPFLFYGFGERVRGRGKLSQGSIT